jgi:hypothetical protein
LAEPAKLRLAAVKTQQQGHARQLRVGFPRHTVGVVGTRRCMWDVGDGAHRSGSRLNHLHPAGSGALLDRPAHRTIHDFESAVEASREEYSGDGARAMKQRPADNPPGIVTRCGEIIAMDPDIPAELQRSGLEAVGTGSDAQWRLNGER